MRFLIVAFAAVSLSACTHIPSAQQTENLESYGAAPVNVDQLVRTFYAANLVDPGSVQYQSISPAERYWLADWASGKPIFGWKTCVRFNARNRMGGYTGASTEALFFRGQQMVHHVETPDQRLCPR